MKHRSNTNTLRLYSEGGDMEDSSQLRMCVSVLTHHFLLDRYDQVKHGITWDLTDVRLQHKRCSLSSFSRLVAGPDQHHLSRNQHISDVRGQKKKFLVNIGKNQKLTRLQKSERSCSVIPKLQSC